MISTKGGKLAILTSVLLCACATPTVVQSVKPGDTGLTCAQLQNEFADADRLRNEADKEKSVTGGNVVRALLFWPAILGTAANANEAIAAADTRKVHLANQMSLKKCAIPSAGADTAANMGAAQPATVATTSKDVELVELKRLHDSNLITKEDYDARQKMIMSAP